MADEGMDWHLQKGVASILQGDSDFMALISNKLYQDVPDQPVEPYVVLGDSQDSDDSVQCLDASEIFFDVHVWSKEPGYKQVKTIAARVRKLLHNATVPMDEERCVLIQHRITRTFSDQDIILKHSVVTFHALTEITSYLQEGD